VLIPTDGDCRPAPAASQRPVPAPDRTSHLPGSRLTRHQRGFKPFARPVFPSLWPPGWNGPPLDSSLGLRTPPTRSRRRTPRWGQAIEHGPGTTAQLTSVDLQSGSSLNTCDLASHVAEAIAGETPRNPWKRSSTRIPPGHEGGAPAVEGLLLDHACTGSGAAVAPALHDEKRGQAGGRLHEEGQGVTVAR
jgi:hypothetical protein